MASDSAARPVNGNYGSMNSYSSGDQQLSSHATAAGAPNPGSAGTDAQSGPQASASASATSAEGSSSVPKDEVGWYFVEQYYTTLSKNPEKLHLFYNKRSQFVSGVEAEKVSVSVGQRAINEHIKELDIQDCKVRVSNVDSQESFKNIVVQVIGEMSNKAAPHRKFVQTFVLAEQPNGYFVLNDIFRYIEDEEEDFEPEEPPAAQAAGTEEPAAALTASEIHAQQQPEIEEVDKKLEAEVEAKKAAPEESTPESPSSNGASAEAIADEKQESEPAAAISIAEEQNKIKPDDAEKAAGEENVEPEKPKDPDPTPIASPPKPIEAAPAQAAAPPAPPKPAAPKTWANLVAANRVAAPAIPSPASSGSPAPSQPKNTSASATQPANTPATSTEEAQLRSQANGNAGWQMAGTDNNRRQTRGQSMSGNPDKDTILGYVKNVTDKVDASILKNTLNQYGKLAYFDVSRAKNCAFVEFETLEGYNAAVSANPHSIGGEQIYVEERRPRNAPYGGFNPRGGLRGGRGGGDGRPGSQGRGNFPKDGGRGGFVPRGRGGSMTPRGGRGQPQAA
ncbi:MAG: hypothetical protein LQ343_003993 [Gyalolechia ehrenbergii]|nr:MAG: hypothetical protein LQ343_003993 [Gyalolechia ehrenbergii]